jgi:twitching motility protein PilU
MNDPTQPTQADVFSYLALLPQQGGSDMFFSVGAPPHIKVEGHSRPVGERPLLAGEVRLLACQLMTPEQIADFERDLEMNLAISVPGSGRFRANMYFQRGDVAMVVRLIKEQIPDTASLGLPPILEKLAVQDRGLILVVGAAGSGKSTTLASLLDFRNRHRSGHIVCIEDPIEFLHSHQRSIIDQREVGLDTHSFADALRNVLREAPDVIMLGEIRDGETMQQALHYAETGHLCVATLHGTSSRHAIERIARFFPDEARHQVLADLSQNLLALIGQRLGLDDKASFDQVLQVNHHPLRVHALEDDRAWLDFSELFERPRSAADYLWLIEHFPRMAVSGLGPLGDYPPDVSMRFLNFIDIAYDRQLRLQLFASVSLERLAEGGAAIDFARTLSRLRQLKVEPLSA